MGLRFLHSNSVHDDPMDTSVNPCDYVIKTYTQIGIYLIVEVKYPHCTNFEGNKVLVFKDVSIQTIRSQTILDPHFSENGLSPVARFVPTWEGVKMARAFAKAMY